MLSPILLLAAKPRPEPGGLDSSFSLADATVVLGAAIGLVIAFALFVVILQRFVFICRPNEILIFSGRKHTLPDGSVAGYKILRGGRGLRRPFIETVHRMDMRLFPVEVQVNNAYSKGGIPLSVHAIANVKIASSDAILRNAAERFLGQHLGQISMVAQQTLEGVLREVVAQLTPEEVNEDRLKFADSLMENARDDFDKLGLELDVLKVQHVSDEQKYLENLGRGRIATMLRDAANAENAANQAVAEAEAAARQRAQSAQKVAETTLAQSRNGVRAEMAKLEAQAKQVENEAAVAAETERMLAEQELQSMRRELETLRLQCEVVLPAEAHRRAAELRARGEAAPTVENGKATAEALRLIAHEWASAGTTGKEVYVLQQLRALVAAAATRVSETEIGDLQVVTGAEENAFGAVVASYPAAIQKVLGEMSGTLGIDVRGLLGSVERRPQ